MSVLNPMEHVDSNLPKTGRNGRQLPAWERSGDWIWGKQRLPPQGAGPHPMPYPYTHGARMMQFPWANHYRYSWVFRSWWWGHVACIPLFTYITYKFGDFGIFGFSKKRVKKEEGGH